MTSEALFLERLARLCRVPLPAMPLQRGGDTPTAIQRTCIDGGRDLMLTCQTFLNGPVTMAIASAASASNANTRRWKRAALGAPVGNSESLIFGKPAASDLPMALDLVTNRDAITPQLNELLARGTVYMATRDEPGTGRDWISIALGRRNAPRSTLAALGLPNVWGGLKTCVSDLVGRSLGENARPWSLALSPATQGHGAALRAGTTLWARQSEDAGKRRRFADQIDSFGGAGAQLGGVYEFISRQSANPRGVGVAAEFDFDIQDQRLIGAHYTFRVPALTSATRTVLETQHG